MSFYDNFSPFKFRDRSNHNSFVNDLRKELENDRKMFEGNFGNFFSPNIHTSRRGGDLRSRMGQDFFKNFDGPQAGSSASSAASSSSSKSPGAGERVIPIHVVTGDEEDSGKSSSRPTSSASNPAAQEGRTSADNQKAYSTQRNNTTEMPRAKDISRGQRAQSAPPASDIKMTECGGGQSKKNSAFRNIPIQVESGQTAGRAQQQDHQQQHSSTSSKGNQSAYGGSGGGGNRSSDQESKPTPPKKPTLVLDPLAKISAVEEQVQGLAEKVNLFNKSANSHKEYLYLDEMLTRCLIQLDDVEVEGRDDVRQARRECIKAIQKCIADLEVKAQGDSKASSSDQNPPPADDTAAGINETTDETMKDVQEIPESTTQETPGEGGNSEMKGDGDAKLKEETAMAVDDQVCNPTTSASQVKKENPTSVQDPPAKLDTAKSAKHETVAESTGVTEESDKMETA